MAADPLVSVIIPAFNAEKFVGEAVESVLAQTYGHVETIVIDDGSTDGTAQVVRRYSPKVLYHYQANSGGCAVPRNTGIRLSRGDLLAFLDADDVMLPERLAREVEFLQRHPDVGLVFSDYRNFDESGPFSVPHFESCPRLSARLVGKAELVLESARLDLVEENFGCGGALMVCRNVLLQEGGFEASLPACEDFHLYFRLARHASIGVVNHVGMMRRLHRGNMSGDHERMLVAGIASRGMLRESEPDRVVRAGLDRYISDCHASLARLKADRGDYVQALLEDGRALSGDRSWPNLKRMAKGVARTGLLAAGVYRTGLRRD